jgi:hypothetical protein
MPPSATLVPVDHEPSFGGVSLVPVDHAPDFGPTLVPVDHNPFDYSGVGAAMPESYGANVPIRDPLANAVMSAASLATLPKRAIDASAADLTTMGSGQPMQSIGPAVETALSTMGGGGLGGAEMKAGETALGAGPIRAYHGTPHDFDAFDVSKIGTGEGAQAYGHGLYFAENEGIARAYRNKLADTPATARFYLDRAAGDPSRAANDYWTDVIRGPNMTPAEMEQAKQTAAVIQRGGAGRMYKVDIDADPAQMLDWDKPLEGQNIWEKVHPNVREAIDEAMDNRMMNPMSDALEAYTGRDLHNALRHEDVHEALPGEIGNSSWYTGNTTEKRHTAEYLQSLDIPGIKYLDQGSRAAGDGSRNFVVFNDKLINIVRKYAAAGIALPPAIAAEYDQMKSSQQPNYAAGLGLH